MRKSATQKEGEQSLVRCKQKPTVEVGFCLSSIKFQAGFDGCVTGEALACFMAA